uniref:Uncharacterized protein n=1 Tax=Oryza brachyantha TaxID=4533 RepID=J3M4Y5_ORYBR
MDLIVDALGSMVLFQGHDIHPFFIAVEPPRARSHLTALLSPSTSTLGCVHPRPGTAAQRQRRISLQIVERVAAWGITQLFPSQSENQGYDYYNEYEWEFSSQEGGTRCLIKHDID